jgi:hypothetical protein
MNVIEFYPSKFCLITDLLDTFGKISRERKRKRKIDYKTIILGKLVYTRLLEKSAPANGKIRK